jgi:hypothetical protein
MVLLKNEGGLLPLNRKQKISLVGTLADNAEEVCGAWAMAWKKEDCVSIRAGLEAAGADVHYYPCGGPEGEIDFDEADRACADADVIVETVQAAVGLEYFRRLGHCECHGYWFGTAEGRLYFPVYKSDDLFFPVVHFFSLIYSTDLCSNVSMIFASLSTSSGNPKLTVRYFPGS